MDIVGGGEVGRNAVLILCEEAQVGSACISPGEGRAFQRGIVLAISNGILSAEEVGEGVELVVAGPAGCEGVLVFLIAVLRTDCDLMGAFVKAEDIGKM